MPSCQQEALRQWRGGDYLGFEGSSALECSGVRVLGLGFRESSNLYKRTQVVGLSYEGPGFGILSGLRGGLGGLRVEGYGVRMPCRRLQLQVLRLIYMGPKMHRNS